MSALSQIVKNHLEFLELFIADISSRGMTERTIKTYRSVIKNAMLIIGDKPLPEWSDIDFTRFLSKTEELFNQRRKAAYTRDYQAESYVYKKFSARTKVLKKNALRSFINFCMDENLITTSALKFRKIRERISGRFMNRVELDEMLDFISKIKKKRHQMMFTFQYGTMLRIHELVKVKFSEIDFVDWMLKVKGKGGKDRKVYFDEDTYGVIYDYICEFFFRLPIEKIRAYFDSGLKIRIPETLKPLYEMVYNRDPTIFKTDRFSIKKLVLDLGDEFVFRGNGNKPYKGVSSLHRILDGVNRENKFSKKITSHFFRGNGACERNERGAQVEELQLTMGHSSPNTTMNYLDPDKQRLQARARETAFLSHAKRIAKWS